MTNFKKVLIINNLLILAVIFFSGCFLWLQKGKVTPIVVPSATMVSPGSFGEQALIVDPKQGNSGDVQLIVDKTKKPIEISWPKEYDLYSLTLKALGPTESIDDNITIWSFIADKPSPPRLFPQKGPVTIERTKVEPPINFGKINNKEITIVTANPETMREGHQYSVEALFEKEGEDKVYTGLYGFTY